MNFLPKLVRAALMTGNKSYLNNAFTQRQAVDMPNAIISQTYKAASFRPKLEAFNTMHNWLGSALHPCFPQVLGFDQQLSLLLHRSSPFPLMGLVHLNNQIIINRLPENDDMSLDYQYGNVRFHQKGIVFSVEMSAHQASKLCLSSQSDYLYRVDPMLLTDSDSSTETDPQPELKHKPSYDETVTSDFDGIHLPEQTGRRYARISGDYNPIHLSKWSAGLFGFKKPIAHGMHTLALAVSAIHLKRSHNFDSSTIRNEFLNPALLPCDLQLKNAEQGVVEHFELINTNASKHKQTVISASIQPNAH